MDTLFSKKLVDSEKEYIDILIHKESFQELVSAIGRDITCVDSIDYLLDYLLFIQEKEIFHRALFKACERNNSITFVNNRYVYLVCEYKKSKIQDIFAIMILNLLEQDHYLRFGDSLHCEVENFHKMNDYEATAESLGLHLGLQALVCSKKLSREVLMQVANSPYVFSVLQGNASYYLME